MPTNQEKLDEVIRKIGEIHKEKDALFAPLEAVEDALYNEKYMLENAIEKERHASIGVDVVPTVKNKLEEIFTILRKSGVDFKLSCTAALDGHSLVNWYHSNC